MNSRFLFERFLLEFKRFLSVDFFKLPGRLLENSECDLFAIDLRFQHDVYSTQFGPAQPGPDLTDGRGRGPGTHLAI